MLATLLASALLMGLAGTPHCLAMCGAACAAVGHHRRPSLALHLGRFLSYSAAGAVAAGSVGTLAALGQTVGVLRPLWTLVHMAALVLGVWLLWRGQQPAWMESLGRNRAPTATVSVAAASTSTTTGWQAMAGPLRRTGIGLAWVAWPCGLLQSALLVASLANSPWQGALVMAAFASTSALGLVLGPALWWRIMGGRSSPANAWASPALAVRLAGAALAAASAWALGHGVWLRFWGWCIS